MTTRRSFLAGILAAGVAPAAVASGILMPVRRIIAPQPFVISGFGLAAPGVVIDGGLIVRGSIVYDRGPGAIRYNMAEADYRLKVLTVGPSR